jgi:hypothetical protein
MRELGPVALTLSLSSEALAEKGVMQRISCAMVRVYVAKYSASAAKMWARNHGATDAQIKAARECLKGKSKPRRLLAGLLGKRKPRESESGTNRTSSDVRYPLAPMWTYARIRSQALWRA